MSEVKEVLLDVRSPAEFAEGHAEGAINIPVGELSFRLRELNGSAPIAVYCRSGARSAAAARLLRLGGFKVEDCSTLAQANARLARLASAG